MASLKEAFANVEADETSGPRNQVLYVYSSFWLNNSQVPTNTAKSGMKPIDG